MLGHALKTIDKGGPVHLGSTDKLQRLQSPTCLSAERTNPTTSHIHHTRSHQKLPLTQSHYSPEVSQRTTRLPQNWHNLPSTAHFPHPILPAPSSTTTVQSNFVLVLVSYLLHLYRTYSASTFLREALAQPTPRRST